jgi:prephenate dehydrogenase
MNRVSIIGLGLMGGSLGMALKRHHVAREVVGWSRKGSTLQQAKRKRAIDVGTSDLRAAVRDADIVVLATPVSTIVPFGKRVAPLMSAGSILTDVGSSKTAIVAALESIPRHVKFVGGHPLAGSEERGIEAATADLFDDSIFVVTPTSRTNPAAARTVSQLWKSLGTRVHALSPSRHDALLAQTSHLSHLLAWCLTSATTRDAQAIAPPSFIGMTRIAQSDPDLWMDIVLSNRRHIAKAMTRFDREWHQLRSLLTSAKTAPLRQWLVTAQRMRKRLHV